MPPLPGPRHRQAPGSQTRGRRRGLHTAALAARCPGVPPRGQAPDLEVGLEARLPQLLGVLRHGHAGRALDLLALDLEPLDGGADLRAENKGTESING